MRHDNNELIWNFANVQKEIIPYPKHGKYNDGEREGMEDEAVESVVAEVEKPWHEDGDAAVQAADDESRCAKVVGSELCWLKLASHQPHEKYCYG